MRPRRTLCLVLACAASMLGVAGTAQAATLPSGFQETTALSGLTNPTQVEFSPDGRVFVAEKSGLIKVFSGLSDTTPTTFADLRTNVHNFWDRGLLGLALAPNFPTDPYVYALYTHDAAIGGTAPRWGTAGATSDGCPTPPGATGDGCVVSGRVSRLQAAGDVMTGSEQVLIEDWCQQYPSHSVGDLAFGADGALYVTGGDGASFLFADYGQDGSPLNPCGDPPAGVGGIQTPPSAEGGALRSQDVRTGGSGGGGGGGSQTFLVRPNADVFLDWGVCCNVTDAWDTMDENVTEASGHIPEEDFIYSGELGKATEVAFANPQLGGATPSAGTAWWFMDVAPGQTVRADVIWGGSVRASKSVSGGADSSPHQWHSINVVPPDQAAADDLSMRFTVTTQGSSTADVYAAYFELQISSGAPVEDPTGLDGAVLRVDPATGAGLPGNPLASSTDANARRIVAYGLRNPFRFAIRPGTNEVWLGDVGWNDWEEINRVANPTDATADNFGWPCYEGTGRQFGYDGADLTLCESLYTAPNVVNPHYAYNHANRVVTGETCPTGSSSLAGVDFYTTGPYPADYDGAMFFADYSRDCIWAMKASGGLPSPSQIVTFAAGAANPVDVTVGPDGDLFYADFDGGTIRRVSFAAANQPPTAVAAATPTNGAAPLAVQFDGAGSSDPDPGDTLSYAWDLDNDGAFDDSTAVNPTRTYAAGTHLVTLRVTDQAGASDTDAVTINAGNSPPQATIASPAAGTLWQVGQTVAFSGSATDTQDGSLGASRLSWQLDLEHCPSTCHTHTIQTYAGVASGSFVAPDHEYPSHLNLKLTATDSGGLTDTKTVRLDPRTVTLTFVSSPSGLLLTVNGASARATFARTVIQGSRNSISAPTPQKKSGKSYAFSTWSDGGAATHDIVAGATATFTATYQRVTKARGSGLCAKKGKGKKKKKKKKKKRKRC